MSCLAVFLVIVLEPKNSESGDHQGHIEASALVFVFFPSSCCVLSSILGSTEGGTMPDKVIT